MTENELFVDNPLTLGGLFKHGIYVIPEKKSTAFQYVGKGLKGVLHIVVYDGMEMPSASMSSIQKIMASLKLGLEDYAIIDAGKLNIENAFNAILEDFKPNRVMVWNDQWIWADQEVRFYQESNKENIRILRCHSMETVMADEERKRECWTSIQQLFKEK